MILIFIGAHAPLVARKGHKKKKGRDFAMGRKPGKYTERMAELDDMEAALDAREAQINKMAEKVAQDVQKAAQMFSEVQAKEKYVNDSKADLEAREKAVSEREAALSTLIDKAVNEALAAALNRL